MYLLVFVWCMIFTATFSQGDESHNETKNEGDTFILDCHLGAATFQGLKIVRRENESVIIFAHLTAEQSQKSCDITFEPDKPYRYNFSCDADDAILRLELDNVSNNDHGTTFECSATDSTVSTLLKVNVPLKYVNISQTINGNVTIDTNNQMQCITSPSRPPANIKWYMQSTLLNSDDIVKTEYMSSNGNLTVTKSTFSYHGQKDDNGKTLYCTADNGFGETKTNDVLLNVLYGPTDIKFQPENLVLMEGIDSPPVTCSVDCNPPCKIRWLKNDTEFINKQVLNLGDAVKEDAESYRCYADNDYGNTSRDLNVTFSYISVSVSSEHISCSRGSNIKISCSRSGAPSINVLPWEHRFGSKLIRTLPYNELEINKCTYEDAGLYICRANNSLGVYKKDNVSLEIKDKPVIVILPSEDKNGSDYSVVKAFIYAVPPANITLLLKNGIIAPNVTEYTYHSSYNLKIHGVDVMVQGKQVRFVVKGHYNSSDVFKIMSQNDVGKTERRVNVSHSPNDYINPSNNRSDSNRSGLVAVIVIIVVIGFAAVCAAIWYRKKRNKKTQEKLRNTVPREHEDSRLMKCKDRNSIMKNDGDEMAEKTDFQVINYQNSPVQPNRAFQYATNRCFSDEVGENEDDTAAE